MILKQRATLLLSIMLLSNITHIANCADSVSLDATAFLSKIEVAPSLKNISDVVYAEERNIAKDLQISEIVKYFDCQTLAGASFLEAALRLPVNSKSVHQIVAKRQAIISALVNNPEFKAEVDALVTELELLQNKLLELYSDKFRFTSCPEEKLLNSLKSENKNLKYRYKSFMTKTPVGRTIDNFIDAGLTYFCGKLTWGFGKVNYAFFQQYNQQTDPNVKKKMLVSASMILAANGYFAYQTAKCASGLVKEYQLAASKRDLIFALSKVVRIAERMEKICAEQGVTADFKISAIQDEPSLTLIKKLKSGFYTKKEESVFVPSLVHAFLYDIYEKESCLPQIFACVAEMDAYNAIATKMLNTQGLKNSFCFATFIDSTKSEIKAVNFWNVLVGEQKAIANTLHETRNIIFSGVNAGGKTTGTRSILQNIVLAQTFGVAAATEFALTPFDIIHSYLNVSDDLIGGSSLFVSEVKRAQEIKEKIRAIAGTDLKYFFALDELFTGTGADAGENCACGFVDAISNAPEIMFIYPTHFDKLKELGESHDFCVNYKVDSAITLKDGKLVYPFTISNGASYDNIALQIAQNANLFN